MECLTVIRDGHGAVIIPTRVSLRSLLSCILVHLDLLSLYRWTKNLGSWEYRQGVFCFVEHAWKRSFVSGITLGSLGSHGSPSTYQCTHPQLPGAPHETPLYFTQTSLCFTKPATVSLLYTQTQYLANRWGTPTLASQQIVYLLHENQEIQKKKRSPSTCLNKAEFFAVCLSKFHPQLAVGATDGTCARQQLR